MKKHKLPISIVIPCSDDIRLSRCLASIDVDAEVIVSLNRPSEEIRKIVKNFGVNFVEIPEQNLAKALNCGAEKASNQKIIFIDSDCVFHKGAIKRVFQFLDEHMVVKGFVNFASNNFQSKIVSNARDYVYNNPPKPYNPFLAVRKELKTKIGGYYFNSSIYWTEDADLQLRLEQAGVVVGYAEKAKATHDPLTFKQDLRSSFRYGIGKRIRVDMGIATGTGVHFDLFQDIWRKKGLITALYMTIWNISFVLGYFLQKGFDLYKTKGKISGK